MELLCKRVEKIRSSQDFILTNICTEVGVSPLKKFFIWFNEKTL